MNIAFSKSRHHTPFKGFTFIEILVCLVALTGGILALLNFYSTFQSMISESRIQLQATTLAEQKLRQLESYLGKSDTRLVDGSHSENITGSLSDFLRSWTVTTDGKLASRKNLDVSVAWTDRVGQIRAVQLGSSLYVRSSTEPLSTILEVIAWDKKTEGGNAWGIP